MRRSRANRCSRRSLCRSGFGDLGHLLLATLQHSEDGLHLGVTDGGVAERLSTGAFGGDKKGAKVRLCHLGASFQLSDPRTQHVRAAFGFYARVTRPSRLFSRDFEGRTKSRHLPAKVDQSLHDLPADLREGGTAGLTPFCSRSRLGTPPTTRALYRLLLSRLNRGAGEQ